MIAVMTTAKMAQNDGSKITQINWHKNDDNEDNTNEHENKDDNNKRNCGEDDDKGGADDEMTAMMLTMLTMTLIMTMTYCRRMKSPELYPQTFSLVELCTSTYPESHLNISQQF